MYGVQTGKIEMEESGPYILGRKRSRMLISMSEEELKEYERDLYELRCYLKRDGMQIASDKVLVRENKLQACLKGEEGLSEKEIADTLECLLSVDDEHGDPLFQWPEQLIVQKKLKKYLGE